MKKHEKEKEHKFNAPRILVLVLIIYILVFSVIYFFKQPVKHYEITGNTVLKDIDIIRNLKLDNYPSYVSINTRKLRKQLEDDSLIKSAKVKYGFNYKIKIEIEENKPVFIYKPENKIVLADGDMIDLRSDVIGIPTLLNNTPEKERTLLANNLSILDDGILYSISEIEYKPSYNPEQKVIDANRFLLSMNDNNLVYITSKKAEMMNKYLDIIATTKITGNGTLYLDGDENGSLFELFQ